MTDSKPWRSDPVTALKSPRIIVVSCGGIADIPVVGKRCPCQRRRMAVLGHMLQSLTDDHVCEPNEHITVCQRLESEFTINCQSLP